MKVGGHTKRRKRIKGPINDEWWDICLIKT